MNLICKYWNKLKSFLFPTKPQIIYTPYNNYNSLKDNEQELITLINLYRDQNDLLPLIPDKLIYEKTKIRTRYFLEIQDITHFWVGIVTEQLKDCGFTRNSEILGKGYTKPQTCLNAWINSIDHNEALLDTEFTHIGVSIVYDDYAKKHYYCAILSKR